MFIIQIAATYVDYSLLWSKTPTMFDIFPEIVLYQQLEGEQVRDILN